LRFKDFIKSTAPIINPVVSHTKRRFDLTTDLQLGDRLWFDLSNGEREGCVFIEYRYNDYHNCVVCFDTDGMEDETDFEFLSLMHPTEATA
jgi:hypothetical protein